MEKIFKSRLVTCVLILILSTSIFVFAGDVVVKNGRLDVDGHLNVGGALEVAGNSFTGGYSSIGGNLYVVGNLDVDGTLDVAGTLYANSHLFVGGQIDGFPNKPDAYIHYLHVTYNAMIYDHLTVTDYISSYQISCYKFHCTIEDPAGVLYDEQTRQEIIGLVKGTIPPDKQGGALVFFNKDTKRLEVYIQSEGKFYDLQGNLIYTMPSIEVATDYKTHYYLDIMTGEVKARKEVVVDKYAIKKGFRLDGETGHFINTVSGEIVPKEEAVEIKPGS